MEDRRDLLDGVIRKGAAVTVWFIENVRDAKDCVLAALFDKGERMIDGVLERIEYDDGNLCSLTSRRPELAVSFEKFFRVLDKIEEQEYQEWAVCEGVRNLLVAGRHDLVVPLVNALGKRTFKSNRLKENAIQWAFYEGVKKSNQDIVGVYCEHPAITSEEYAIGLMNCWNNGKPNQASQFILGQADQGDLNMAKWRYEYDKYPKFRLAIDKAFEAAPSAGSRHRRYFEKAIAKLAVDTLDIVYSTNMWHQEPGIIIEEYLVGEKEKTKGGESEAQEAGAENHTD